MLPLGWLTDDPLLTPTTKGIPAKAGRFRLSAIGEQGWNVMAGDLPLPLMLIKDSALYNNLRSMQAYCDAQGALLAPHGKTTMCPAVWRRQLENGAWAITVASVEQAQVALAARIPRILIANEVVDRQGLDTLATVLSDPAAPELYVWVDSLAGIDLLSELHLQHALGEPWRVLVEVGWPGGRAGLRSDDDVHKVVSAIRQSHGRVEAVGLAIFEGILQRDAEHPPLISQILDRVVNLADALTSEGALPEDLILSAGGSKTFDLVADSFRRVRPKARIVLRAGCYAMHDHGRDDFLSPLGSHGGFAERFGKLEPAIELWACVLSKPDSDLAILGFGKRDVSFDAGLPVPIGRFPKVGGPRETPPPGEIFRLNDQHAYWRVDTSEVEVGDRIVLGVAHPCTALDKWRFLAVVDDDYNVIDGYCTYF